jgi:hypothetical protein
MSRDADWKWKEVKLGFTVSDETLPNYVYRWSWFWKADKLMRGDWERIGGIWPIYRLRRAESIMDLSLSSKLGLQSVIDQHMFSDGTLSGIAHSSNPMWKRRAAAKGVSLT